MRLRNLYIVIAVGCILCFCNCSKGPSGGQNNNEINVAAAANLTDAFEELGRQFTAQTDIKVVYSFGSTADLTKQIENGGPFDVFASADVEHVDELKRKGLVLPDSRVLYARGRLVVWIPTAGHVAINRIEDITAADVKIVAIAKPDLAPYGKASVEALRALNIWSQVETKVVYGMNVAQVKQYAVSGNADAAFLPLSLVKADEGQYIEVDEKLHQPIDQALGIVKASAKQEYARRFVDFVLSAEGQALLQKYGYSKPPGQ